jgi:hypothetical protein
MNGINPTSRRPFRLWLAGIAAGTLVAVALAPATGWIARGHLAVLFGLENTTITRSMGELGLKGYPSSPTWGDRRELDNLVKSRPNDFPLQMAIAMRIGAEERSRTTEITKSPQHSLGAYIRRLANRFGDQPGLYATAIRMDTTGYVRVARPETALLTEEHMDDKPRPQQLPSPDNLATFDQDCATGERLEPDNAYFPAMRAIGQFGARQDALAIESLIRASTKSRWDEHIADEVNGKWRLSETESGGRNALGRMAVSAAILFPHYAQLRAAAQMATLKAMEEEQNGRPKEGARIRTALMRIGDMMRYHSTSLIGCLVGVAETHIAFGRPGGAPPIKARAEVGSGFTAREQDENARMRFQALADYWEQNGLSDDVPTAKARMESGIKTRNQIAAMLPVSTFNEKTFAWLALLWCGGALVLANVWWLLVFGGIGSIVLSRRVAGRRERMPKSGPYVLAVVSVLFVLLCVRAAVSQHQFVDAHVQIVSAFQGMEPGKGEPETNPMRALDWLFAAAPTLIIVMSAIVSLVRRVPLRVGISQGLSRVGIPAACLLVLAFSGLCVVTARYEDRVNAAIEQTVRHEGRYLSRLTGQEWQPPVE